MEPFLRSSPWPGAELVDISCTWHSLPNSSGTKKKNSPERGRARTMQLQARSNKEDLLRSFRLSLTGRYRSTDLHYSHSFNVTVSYHISSKFGSIYLSISFSFASYPYALFTPAFADGAVQISLSISLHYRFPRGPDVAESQPPPPTHD